MEGNECYKFATISHYIHLTHADPVRVMIDIGANLIVDILPDVLDLSPQSDAQ